MKTLLFLILLLPLCCIANESANGVTLVGIEVSHVFTPGEIVALEISFDDNSPQKSWLYYQVPEVDPDQNAADLPGSSLLAGSPSVATVLERARLHLSRQPPKPVSIQVYQVKGALGIIYVVGMVKNPGSYLINSPNYFLTDAIEAAGGLNRLACSSRTIISRPRHGAEKERTEVSLDSITNKKVENPLLQNGETVFVPEIICF